VTRLKAQCGEHKEKLVKTIEFLENNSTISDYDLIDNHRELFKLASADEEDMSCGYSVKYKWKESDDKDLNSLMGQTFEDISATETNS
jgi:hypothetical protein